MKMKIEIEVTEIVALHAALNSARRRIEELMNDKPQWRRLYELDQEQVETGKKILAKVINKD